MPAWFARPTVFSLQQEWTASEMLASIIALFRCDLFAEIQLMLAQTFRVAEQLHVNAGKEVRSREVKRLSDC
jgi:hypothetical protein